MDTRQLQGLIQCHEQWQQALRQHTGESTTLKRSCDGYTTSSDSSTPIHPWVKHEPQGGWGAISLLFSDWLLLDYDKNTSSNPHFWLLLHIQNILLCTLMLEMQMVFRIPWVRPIKYATYLAYIIHRTQGTLNTIWIYNIRVQSRIFWMDKRSKKCGLLLVFLP